MARLGLVPEFVTKKLGIACLVEDKSASSSCCNGGSCSDKKDDGDLKHVLNPSDWNTLVRNSSGNVVVKFTASWCKPCQKIQPFFVSLGGNSTQVTLVEVDVDHDCLSGIVSELRVSMLPTFVQFKGGKEVTRYTGSDKSSIRKLVVE